MSDIPTAAYLPKHGRVRVLYYHANGLFWVLTKRDERRLVHRDDLVFCK